MVWAAWGLSDYLGQRRTHSKAVSGKERGGTGEWSERRWSRGHPGGLQRRRALRQGRPLPRVASDHPDTSRGPSAPWGAPGRRPSGTNGGHLGARAGARSSALLLTQVQGQALRWKILATCRARSGAAFLREPKSGISRAGFAWCGFGFISTTVCLFFFTRNCLRFII